MVQDAFDYLIVGAGFAGSVLAERLASSGKKVLLIDKRKFLGGNSYDYFDKNGVLIHKFGPHYFRTNSDRVFKYLSNFTKWRLYEYRVKASVNGKLYPIPINRETINKFFNKTFKTEEEVKAFLEEKREKIENPKNSEELILSTAGKEIYDAFFKNYTTKQWGVSPKELDSSVCGRIAIRTNDDDRYFTDKHQAMPKDGYNVLFKNMLNNPNITIKLNTDFKKIMKKIKYNKLIFTGCIDSFFDYKFGKLQYRSLKFKINRYNKEFYQNWSQINYPNDPKFTRKIEIKHATGQKINKTTVITEFPRSSGEPLYPIPDEKNKKLYQLYESEAKKLGNTYFIGRLAEYKYLNMDQVVEKALNLFEMIKNE